MLIMGKCVELNSNLKMWTRGLFGRAFSAYIRCFSNVCLLSLWICTGLLSYLYFGYRYAMHELGLSSKKPYKKCARVVGEVVAHLFFLLCIHDRMYSTWYMKNGYLLKVIMCHHYRKYLTVFFSYLRCLVSSILTETMQSMIPWSEWPR